MDKINDIEERKWYIKEIVQKGWSSNMLKMQIDGKVYERQALAEKTTNFDLTLPSVQSDLAIQTMKDPYLFDFISIKGKVKELEIENAMINKIKDVLIELGKGFAFVGSEYKLEVGGKEYFIDLLFYHLKLKCYIVVELKAREFEPTDAGQLNFYLSAVDDLVKDKDDNATIGLLLCKGKDNFTAEYALKDINKPIGVSEYKLLEDMPEYLQSQLPRTEDSKNIAIFLFFKSWLYFYFRSFLISSNKIGLNSSIGKGILYKIELKEVELASSIIINKVASGHLSLILFFSTPFIKILKIEPSS